MQKRKPLDVTLLVFKIVIPVFLAVLLILFSVDLYQSKMQDLNAPEVSGTISIDAFPLAFAVLLIVMLLAALLAFILSLAGLITALVYKKSERRKKHILAFSILLPSSPIAFFIFVLIGKMIETIGA